MEAELWPDGPICPHCGNWDQKKIGRLQGKTTRIGLRKCYACKKPFTVKVGTIFEDSHAPLHLWLQAIHLMVSSKKGISTRQLQRTLDVGMKTAWFMGMRIRKMMERYEGAPPVGGEGEVIEADWTYVGRKPGTKVRRGAGHMNPVFALVERHGEVRSFHVPNVTASTLPAILEKQGSHKSRLHTDEAPVLRWPGLVFESHETVNHGKDEYVRGDVYTNTIEGFFSILKRGVYGVYQHVSEAHLQRYLTEFDFRYSQRERLGVDDSERASIALRGATGRRLTYERTREQRGAEAS